jgi:26S proteasome regulatory subunit T5
MEVDEKRTEVYTDIGGLNQQIEEVVEAVVLPMQHQEKFKTLGIKPPKAHSGLKSGWLLPGRE